MNHRFQTLFLENRVEDPSMFLKSPNLSLQYDPKIVDSCFFDSIQFFPIFHLSNPRLWEPIEFLFWWNRGNSRTPPGEFHWLNRRGVIGHERVDWKRFLLRGIKMNQVFGVMKAIFFQIHPSWDRKLIERLQCIQMWILDSQDNFLNTFLDLEIECRVVWLQHRL